MELWQTLSKKPLNVLTHFSCVFTCECTVGVSGISPKTTLKIDKVPFDEEEVKKIIFSSPTSRSPGPDGITNLLIKKGGSILAKNCATFFYISLYVLLPWWTEEVFHCSYLQRDRSYNSLWELQAHLHGFLHQRSTLTILLEYLQFVISSLDREECVDTVHLDLWKAFDSDPHQRFA